MGTESNIEVNPAERRRAQRFWLGWLVLSALFGPWLIAWGWFAWNDDLASYVLLIPCISAYLIWQQPRPPLGSGVAGTGTGNASAAPAVSMGAVAGAAVLAAALAGVAFLVAGRATAESRHDYLAPAFLSYVAAGVAWTLFTLGTEAVRRHAFAVGFMVFAAPLPTWAVHGLEVFYQHTSAEVAAWMINLAQIPNLRSGLIFQLPGITIQVAQECSGIRSSLVLFIVSTLAGYLLLRRPSLRVALAVFVIPLGIVRNGFRILTIAALCTHVGANMIDSPIHHRGGPIFFGLSLIPLFLFLVWLRRRERRRETSSPGARPGPGSPTAPRTGATSSAA